MFGSGMKVSHKSFSAFQASGAGNHLPYTENPSSFASCVENVHNRSPGLIFTDRKNNREEPLSCIRHFFSQYANCCGKKRETSSSDNYTPGPELNPSLSNRTPPNSGMIKHVARQSTRDIPDVSSTVPSVIDKQQLKFIAIDNNLSAKDKALKILSITKSLFDSGIGSANKHHHSTPHYKVILRNNLLTESRNKGTSSINFFKTVIKLGIGNCGEQFRIADIICHYNGIENTIISYHTDPESREIFNHGVCVAKIDGKKYVIDPWANISCEMANKDNRKYFSLLSSRLKEWHDSGYRISSGIPGKIYMSEQDMLQLTNDLMPGRPIQISLTDELYSKIQIMLNKKLAKLHNRATKHKQCGVVCF